MPNKLILDYSVGEHLRQFRIKAGMTQASVVRAANLYGSSLSESTYSKIEQGVRNLYISDLVILRLALGFQYEDLFKDIEKQVIALVK